MRLHVAWRSIIRFIKSIFFKKSVIDRAKHFVISSFLKWLYMSCHKVLGFVGLGVQDLLSDTCVD